MYFSLATIIVVAPLLASASPLAKPSHTTIPLSKRNNLSQPDGSVNVEKLRGHLDLSLAKFERGFDNYHRNTGKRHPMQPEAVATGSKREFNYGSGATVYVELHKQDYKDFWYGPLGVGSPPQIFTVEYDTSSSDLFIPDVTCGDTCDGHRRYNSSASTTSNFEKPFDVRFRDGSLLLGNQYKDHVNVAGLEADFVTVGSTTTLGIGLQSPEFSPDGVLGMGFQSISKLNERSYFQRLVEDRITVDGYFAFRLVEPLSLTLGGVDPSLFTGEPTYTPVTHEGYWQIEFSALKVGNASVVEFPTPAIVDSGTNYIIGSKYAVKEFYAQIPGSEDAHFNVGEGFYTFPCNATIPPISFNIGGKDLPMSPSALIFGSVAEGSETCVGSIVGNLAFGGLGTDFWILGTSWMRNYYTIFDSDHKRVGFATLKGV